MLKCALILYNDINPVGLDVDVRWHNGDILRNGEVNRVTLLYQLARTTSHHRKPCSSVANADFF